ncbi:MAG: alpha/beta fold hydrolase [Alphaproteobacteria bacterium]|jgi:proline iminopeptidase|nr:alpha/beta fold hydrolase [Alphaproteobacteria bacterium]
MRILSIFKKEIKPIEEGYLSEEDGHRVYWARYGNAEGKTILTFHGGPGGSSKPRHAESFDLKKYNVIVFDQRGCGRSEPLGKLENNTTEKIISDAKRIVDLLKVKKLIIVGGSWGSTLALLFCEKFPKMIDKIILSDIFLANKFADKWAFEHTGNMYPDAAEKMLKDKPKNKGIAKYYLDLITSKKETDVVNAMNNFGKYEYTIGKLDVKIDDEVNLNRVNNTKVFLHFMKNKYFIKENQILENIKPISNKKCLIIHNRLDLTCPLKGAWDLNQMMKKSKLVILPVLGHNIYRPESFKRVNKEIMEFLKG